MLDEPLAEQFDKAELAARVRQIASTVCEVDPDTVAAMTLADLDSFTFVQLVLELEHILDVLVLEELVNFSGNTFDDLAVFILERGARAA